MLLVSSNFCTICPARDWGEFQIDVLIDYLRFSSKIHSFANLIELLGLQDVIWQSGKARDGWSLHEYCNGMHLYHGGRDDVGVELSGSGCRMLESCNDGQFNWMELFEYLMDEVKDGEMNVSRLDVACDEKEGLLDLDQMIRYCRQRKYISKARRCIWIGGAEREIMFGASSSSTRLRIYDKALERGVDGHWLRCEFQLRDEAADSFLLNLLQVREIGQTYGGVLLNYLRFTTRSPDGSQNNYDRIPTTVWWSDFVGTAQKIKNLTIGGLEYNYFNLESFIVKQCASSLKAYIEAHAGNVDPLLKLIEEARINPKQRDMLNHLKMECNTELGAAAALQEGG